MNYQNIYNQIIHQAQTRQLEGYVEKHHIVPKCLGGSNSKNNIVQLTAREHFICHALLCEIHPNNDKLKYALFLMAIGKQKTKNKQYKISSRTYERLKLEHILFLTGKKQNTETRKKKSNTMKDVWLGKTKEEIAIISTKRWNTRIKNGTDKQTEQHKERLSVALKGRKITWDRKRDQPISQYDLHLNYIQDWISISEAQRHIGGDIQACCKGKQKTAGGFIWKYKKN